MRKRGLSSPAMDADIALTNARGSRVRFAPLGAAIIEATVPDRSGARSNVVFAVGGSGGKVIGRYANRIAHGRFTLDGTTYTLATNENGNTLHGGPDGFSKRTWDLTRATDDVVEFTLVSPAGDQGFPGALTVHVTYTLDDDDALHIDYRATTDAPTVINLTNHVYFNLTGDPSKPIDAHELEIPASAYTAVDDAGIPTGTLVPVAGTDRDFRTARPIGSTPYDTNFELDGCTGALQFAARLTEAGSGRCIVVETTQPGLQLFSGHPGAVAIETQHFADAPNHPNFPNTTLYPSEIFHSTTIYRFGLIAK